MGEAISKLDDFETRHSIVAERALLGALQGGCQVPLARGHAWNAAKLVLDAVICSPDGQRRIRQKGSAPPEQARDLGRQVAELLWNAGGSEILEQVSRQRG